MSDFSNLDSPLDFAKSAQTLLANARDALRVRDVNKMKQASDELLDFLQQRTSDCPAAVVDAVVSAQHELLLAVDSNATDAIDAATAQLAALLIDVQRVTADLNRQAKLISLQPVIDTLNSVTKLINDAKAIQANLVGQTPATVDLAGLAGGVKDIIEQLSNIEDNLKTVTG